jgi:hypothetical protein
VLPIVGVAVRGGNQFSSSATTEPEYEAVLLNDRELLELHTVQLSVAGVDRPLSPNSPRATDAPGMRELHVTLIWA